MTKILHWRTDAIMSDMTLPGQDSVAAQHELFRRAEAEHGLSIAVLAKRAPISVSTLKGWRSGAAMPAWALGALGEAGIPDDLLSLLLEPFARHVGTNGEGDDDLDALAADAGEFVHAHSRARNAHGPGGAVIVPQERAHLVPLAGRLKARARQVAA
jgi:hypothetical protein